MRGKTGYLNKSLLDEIDSIKREYNYMTQKEAVNKLLEHVRIGKEIERIASSVVGRMR